MLIGYKATGGESLISTHNNKNSGCLYCPLCIGSPTWVVQEQTFSAPSSLLLLCAKIHWIRSLIMGKFWLYPPMISLPVQLQCKSSHPKSFHLVFLRTRGWNLPVRGGIFSCFQHKSPYSKNCFDACLLPYFKKVMHLKPNKSIRFFFLIMREKQNLSSFW